MLLLLCLATFAALEREYYKSFLLESVIYFTFSGTLLEAVHVKNFSHIL